VILHVMLSCLFICLFLFVFCDLPLYLSVLLCLCVDFLVHLSRLAQDGQVSKKQRSVNKELRRRFSMDQGLAYSDTMCAETLSTMNSRETFTLNVQACHIVQDRRQNIENA
jgi:hypothetical protein